MTGILSVVSGWINYDISIGWSFLTARGKIQGNLKIQTAISPDNHPTLPTIGRFPS